MTPIAPWEAMVGFMFQQSQEAVEEYLRQDDLANRIRDKADRYLVGFDPEEASAESSRLVELALDQEDDWNKELGGIETTSVPYKWRDLPQELKDRLIAALNEIDEYEADRFLEAVSGPTCEEE